jgi:hypothetical protein
MTQLDLFIRRKPAKPAKPLTCAFGTEWLAHFDPPIGTGAGCSQCEAAVREACHGD